MSEPAADWLRVRERGSERGLAWMSRLGQIAPEAVTDPLIWLISLYYTFFPDSAPGAASRSYLRAVLGRSASFTERHRQTRTFAHVVFDRVILLGGGFDRFSVRPVGHEKAIRHHSEGRGCVLLSAHFGSFEMLRAFDRTLPGLTVRYLMFQDNAPRSTQLFNSLNPDVASRVIPAKDGPNAMLAARDALDSGEFVAFLGDRMPSRNPRAEIAVDFLGYRARFPRAPYMTAILAGAPLFLCFAPRTGPKAYDIEFAEIYDGAPVARKERDEKCRELAQGFADALADMCRRHPYNWFNFFDVWS